MEATLNITLENGDEFVAPIKDAKELYETLRNLFEVKEAPIAYPAYPYVPWRDSTPITYCKAYPDGSTEVRYSDGTSFNVVSSK